MSNSHDWFFSAIEKLAHAVELRDTCTGEHSRRVTSFALLVGRHLNVSAEELQRLRIVTPLHDIGKIGIEDAILRKPGPLTPQEFDIMKTHTTIGAGFLEPMTDLRQALPIVRSHHERWDGHGYPDGLAGNEIPLIARIVAVADAFDALVFDMPYRHGQPVEAAFAELEKESGRQFDPDVVAAILEIRHEIIEEVGRLRGE